MKDINNLASKSQYNIDIIRRIDLLLFHRHLKHDCMLVSFKRLTFLVIGMKNKNNLP